MIHLSLVLKPYYHNKTEVLNKRFVLNSRRIAGENAVEYSKSVGD
jgi:hypothetical protein